MKEDGSGSPEQLKRESGRETSLEEKAAGATKSSQNGDHEETRRQRHHDH